MKFRLLSLVLGTLLIRAGEASKYPGWDKYVQSLEACAIENRLCIDLARVRYEELPVIDTYVQSIEACKLENLLCVDLADHRYKALPSNESGSNWREELGLDSEGLPLRSDDEGCQASL